MIPGDKVVCVDDSPGKCCGKVVPLIKGNVYIVDKIVVFTPKGMAIQVLGIHSKESKCHYAGFNSNRFRLLDELKQESKQRQSEPQLI